MEYKTFSYRRSHFYRSHKNFNQSLRNTVFYICFWFLYGRQKSSNWVEQGLHNNVAEQILALAFLTAKSIDSSNWISQKTLMQNFSSVDINLLAPYIAQWQTGGEIYSDCFHSGKTFKSSEEIIESF